MLGKTRTGIFYGWAIVAAGFVILMIAWGLLYSYGVFFEDLSKEFGWSRTMVSGAYSVFMVLHCALYPVVGIINDKYGPRKSSLFCVILMSSGFALMSYISVPWQLYTLYGVVIGSGISFVYIPITSTITHWFEKRRGMALGIVTAGVGMGTMTLLPFSQFLISNFGWRSSYLIIAIFPLIIILPVSRLLRLNPSEKGLLPYGAGEITRKRTATSLPSTRNFTLREAVKERNFWILFTISAFGFLAVQLIMVHLKTNITDVGISPMTAATILGTVGGAGLLGRITVGGASDRIGRKRAYFIALLLMAIMMVWLLEARQVWQFFVFSAIFGFGYGGCVPLPAAMIGDWFGAESHGRILGVLSLSGMVAGIGPIIAGYIYDVTGSYNLAFIIAAVMLFVAMCLTLAIKASHAPK